MNSKMNVICLLQMVHRIEQSFSFSKQKKVCQSLSVFEHNSHNQYQTKIYLVIIIESKILRGNFKYSISNKTKVACQLIKIGCMLYYFRIVRVYVSWKSYVFFYLFICSFFTFFFFHLPHKKKKSTYVVYQSFLKKSSPWKQWTFSRYGSY